MDDSEDDFLLEAYENYANRDVEAMDEDDELLLQAYENYANGAEKTSKNEEFLLQAYKNYANAIKETTDNDEFLLRAHRDCDKDAEEWPYFHDVPAYEKYRGERSRPMPLLIMECARLIPKVSEKNKNYVDFHPFNMPGDPIKSINVIGTVVGYRENKSYVDLRVYDGTGSLTVLYKLEKYEADKKRRRGIDWKYGILEKDAARFARLMKQTIVMDGSNRRRRNPALERIKRFQCENSLWWEECERGMLGKPLKVGSYVDVYGYCNLKRDNARNKDEPSNNFWGAGYLPALIFNAYAVKSITEKEYHCRLQEWLKGVVAAKYAAPKA